MTGAEIARETATAIEELRRFIKRCSFGASRRSVDARGVDQSPPAALHLVALLPWPSHPCSCPSPSLLRRRTSPASCRRLDSPCPSLARIDCRRSCRQLLALCPPVLWRGLRLH